MHSDLKCWQPYYCGGLGGKSWTGCVLYSQVYKKTLALQPIHIEAQRSYIGLGKVVRGLFFAYYYYSFLLLLLMLCLPDIDISKNYD